MTTASERTWPKGYEAAYWWKMWPFHLRADADAARRVQQLEAENDALEGTLRRVVANESNHYDRYWIPPDEAISEQWLNEHRGQDA